MGSTVLGLPKDVTNDLAQLHLADSAEMLQSVFKSKVQQEVDLLVDQMVTADAFDLIELMRLHEVPISPVLGLEPGFEGSGAALELISLVLTCRPSRHAIDHGTDGAPNPHEMVPVLHDIAMRLLRLTTFYLMASSRFSDEPLAALAAEYQASVINVRTMQYPQLEDELNTALFDSGRLQVVVQSALGFTYKQFIQIRDAVADLYSDRFMGIRDEIAAIVEEYKTPEAARAAVGTRFEQLMAQMMFLPGDRAQFTAADVAERVDLDMDVVGRVLNVFSIEFSERDPCEAVFAFLRGDNPFRTAGLVTDGLGNYVIAGNPIGTDAFRYVVEESLKGGNQWTTYDKVRTAVSERLAINAVARLLQSEARYRGFRYFAPKGGNDVRELGSRCTNLTQIAKETECDGLFIIDDLALCVEVKGRSIADQARRGDVRRLARELANIVGSAAAQAHRIGNLIQVNGGIWMADRTWLDLDFVREIRSIAVCLDDIGPLAIAMDDLRRAGVLTEDKFPWVTSLHDLSVIAQVIDRPGEFLLYVRRRSDSGIASLYRATDELDLFMLFLTDDHLYIEPDPDQVAMENPMAPPPTKAARRRFRRTQRPVRVLTHTNLLDMWMYRKDGSNPFPAVKPTFASLAFIRELVDYLTNSRPPGWLRITADLLAMSGESQANLERAVKSVVRATQIDHQTHTAIQAFAGLWGLPIIIVGSCPLGTFPAEAVEGLSMYAKAKKRQMRSDRAVVICFDEAGGICGVAYYNDRIADDPEMDELIERLQLRPPRQRSTLRPRKSRQLKPGRGRRKRKKR